MEALLSILSFFFYYLPMAIIGLFRKKKEIPKEDIYYFVGVWVAHQINEEQYQSSFYSLWIRKASLSIPTEKEVKSHLLLFGLKIINFKVISISKWEQKDYNDYMNGADIEDILPVDSSNKSYTIEEVDYQLLLDKAVDEENYEEAARLKKILEEKKNDRDALGE